MKTCVISNPRSGSSDYATQVRDEMEARPGLVWWETRGPDHATELAAQALEEGADLIVSAGGDGTVNEIVNGMSPHFGRALLGVLPLGTANDFARSLGVPLDPLVAVRLMNATRERRVDVMKVEYDGQVRRCVNVASGGFAGKIGRSISPDLKRQWGPLAYLISAIEILPDLEGYRTTIEDDRGLTETMESFNVFVANGRFTGGGIAVAPHADLCDGELELVTVLKSPILELSRASVQLTARPDLATDSIRRNRVQSVLIDSVPGMWFNLDGEQVTDRTVRFSIESERLRVLSGGTW